MELQFSRQIFEKKSKIPYFMKIHPVEDKLFHADGKKDGLRKLIIAFSNYANLFLMCVCVCVYIHIYIYIYIHTYI